MADKLVMVRRLQKSVFSLFVIFSSACSLDISQTKSGSISLADSDGEGGSAPLPPEPANSLDYNKSELLVSPDVESVPSTGELLVRYCLKDQDGNAFDDGTLVFSFAIQGGSSNGSFSSVSYNSTDKCYESTFTADASGSAANIVPQVNATAVASLQTQQITITVPTLNFTGNSQSSTAIAMRIFNENSPAWNLTGTCDPFLGDVSVNGGINAITTTSCAADGTFSLTINVDSVTPPYFITSPFPDPLIMIKQGKLEPKITRLYLTSSTWNNVFITTAAELQAMTIATVNQTKNYFLTSDIDLSSVSATDNFTALGSSGGAGNFWSGRLFGDGHKIQNLHIDAAGAIDQGLLGYVRSAAVYDLAFENGVIINPGSNVGILSGYFRQSNAFRISTQGSVTSITSSAGLLIGYSWASNIYNCYSAGVISANSNTGGFIGRFRNGIIFDSWASAQVTGTGSNVGGLTGAVDFTGVIINSFANSTVSGSSDAVGGLTGFAGELDDGITSVTVENSFSLGNVTGSATLGHISGPIIGSAGIYYPPYTPYLDPILRGLFFLNTATCTNCLNPNVHGTGDSLENILDWTKTAWSYDWIWKMHSSGTRPDLIVNPKP